MPQDWFDSLPKENEKKEDLFDSLPKEYRGKFGLGTATSIGPQKPPKLFSLEGAKQYGGAVVRGVGRLAKGMTELGPALGQLAINIDEDLQNKGATPFNMTGFDVVKSVSDEAVEPLVRGYAEGCC